LKDMAGSNVGVLCWWINFHTALWQISSTSAGGSPCKMSFWRWFLHQCVRRYLCQASWQKRKGLLSVSWNFGDILGIAICRRKDIAFLNNELVV
jgi:hypothetical protein